MFFWATKHSTSNSKLRERNRSRKRRLLFEGLETRRVFAAYEVTTLQDIVNPDDGVMSLREAIAKANETSTSDIVTFASSLMSAGDATIKLNSTELAITQPVEIIGPTSANLTIDAEQKSRVFKIGDLDLNSSQEITISNLRMVNGQSTQGGAIYSTETLILIGCTIENSSSDTGGAIYSTNMLNVWESNLSRNRATQSGGAIYAGSDLSVVDSTIALNSATQNGGGIAIGASNGYFVLINATVMGNTALNGGGLSAESVFSSRIANSIIAGNKTDAAAANDIAGLLQSHATHNVIGVSTVGWNNGVQDNIVGIDWKTIVENDGQLPILKNNGGRTETISLLRNGPAVNRGNDSLFGDLATRYDQRGFHRRQGARVDIGAIELVPIATTTTVTASNQRYDGQDVKLTFEIKSNETTTLIPTGAMKISFYTSADRSELVNTSFTFLENGMATLPYSEENYGIYRIEAEYSGDDNFARSEAASLVRTGKQVDYGDAPSSSQTGFASSYPVTFDEDGARHTYHAQHGVRLGPTNSPSNDGIHSANADADTSDDGVSWLFPLISSSAGGLSSVLIENGGSVAGKIDAWIDFNRDGDWNDAGEKIFDSAVLNIGKRVMPFAVPGGAAVGTTAARFRVSLNGKLGPTGAAYDGEVEDYMVEIVAPDVRSIQIPAETANWISGVEIVSGSVTFLGKYSTDSSDGEVLFKNQFNPEIELVFKASYSFRINRLQLSGLERSRAISVRSRADREVIKLLDSMKYLDVKYSSTGHESNPIYEIDLTHESVQSITLQTPHVPHLRIRHGLEDTVDLTNWSLSGPTIANGEVMHRLTKSGSTLEIINPTPFHNPKNKYDVDIDGTLSAIDVLAIINALTRQARSEPVDFSKMDPKLLRYTDVNGDGLTTPIDVLVLINELNRQNIYVPPLGGFYGSSGSVTNITGGSIRTGRFCDLPNNNCTYTTGNNTSGSSAVLTQSVLDTLPSDRIFWDRIFLGSSGINLREIVKGSMEISVSAISNPTQVRITGRKIQFDPIIGISSISSFSAFPIGESVGVARRLIYVQRLTSSAIRLSQTPFSPS